MTPSGPSIKITEENVTNIKLSKCQKQIIAGYSQRHLVKHEFIKYDLLLEFKAGSVTKKNTSLLKTVREPESKFVTLCRKRILESFF